MILRPAIVLTVGLLGCDGSPAADVSGEAERGDSLIQTDSSEYVLRFDDPGWMTRIGFTYHAESDTVYVVNCNGAILMDLHKLEGGEWKDAWHAEGNACLSPPIVVPPDSDFRGEVIIWGADSTQDSFNTFRVPTIDGEYRLVWNQPVHHYQPELGSFGDTIPLEKRISNRFTLVRARPNG